MKIAWFSPLPPEHTEIANYTARLSGELRRRFETHFFTESPGGFSEPEAAASYPAELGAVAPKLRWSLNQLDLPVYQLGNHPGFFSHTWFLSQSKPGIVVLHDLKLHHFFEGIFRERLHDQAAYLRYMRQFYGRGGLEAGAAYWRQEVTIDFMAEHFPMTAWAIQGALGIVVHTAHALETVRSLTEIPVVLAPLPHQPAAPTRAENADQPAAKFSPARRARLIMFGYLNVNRRLVEFFTALAGMPERRCFEVHVLGTMRHRAEVEAAVAALDLGGHVTLHGYVSDETLTKALERADLAVNLRYPSMGEASASQLRIWDHALPSLVTRTEGYAGLPEDAVCFVRPEHEAADIQDHLRRFLADPERFRAAGRRGRRRLLDQHLPSAYVERVGSFFEAADLLRSRHNQMRLADRSGQASAAWMDAAPLVAREEHYAAVIARTV